MNRTLLCDCSFFLVSPVVVNNKREPPSEMYILLVLIETLTEKKIPSIGFIVCVYSLGTWTPSEREEDNSLSYWTTSKKWEGALYILLAEKNEIKERRGVWNTSSLLVPIEAGGTIERHGGKNRHHRPAMKEEKKKREKNQRDNASNGIEIVPRLSDNRSIGKRYRKKRVVALSLYWLYGVGPSHRQTSRPVKRMSTILKERVSFSHLRSPHSQHWHGRDYTVLRVPLSVQSPLDRNVFYIILSSWQEK